MLPDMRRPQLAPVATIRPDELTDCQLTAMYLIVQDNAVKPVERSATRIAVSTWFLALGGAAMVALCGQDDPWPLACTASTAAWSAKCRTLCGVRLRS